VERTKKRQRKDAPPFHKRQRCVHMTLALEVNSKSGPFQIKGPAPRFVGTRRMAHPPSVTICQVRNKACKLNALQPSGSPKRYKRAKRPHPFTNRKGRPPAREGRAHPLHKTAKGRAPSLRELRKVNRLPCLFARQQGQGLCHPPYLSSNLDVPFLLR
jgi:hypothetical protein